MYGCEIWTIKMAERWRIDAFKLWYWRRPLRVPWTARLKQSILKEINPEYSLERLMLKLKLQYFGHVMQRADTLAEIQMLGKNWRQKEKRATKDEMVRQHHQLNEHESEHTGRWWRTGKPAVLGVTKSQTRLSNWTTTFNQCFMFDFQITFNFWKHNILPTFFKINLYVHLWLIPGSKITSPKYTCNLVILKHIAKLTSSNVLFHIPISVCKWQFRCTPYRNSMLF